MSFSFFSYKVHMVRTTPCLLQDAHHSVSPHIYIYIYIVGSRVWFTKPITKPTQSIWLFLIVSCPLSFDQQLHFFTRSPEQGGETIDLSPLAFKAQHCLSKALKLCQDGLDSYKWITSTAKKTRKNKQFFVLEVNVCCTSV